MKNDAIPRRVGHVSDSSAGDFRPRWGGGKGEEIKHQTPSESPTGVGDHKGFVLGISPPPPEHRGTIDDASDDEDDENDEVDEDDEPPLVDIGKL